MGRKAQSVPLLGDLYQKIFAKSREINDLWTSPLGLKFQKEKNSKFQKKEKRGNPRGIKP